MLKRKLQIFVSCAVSIMTVFTMSSGMLLGNTLVAHAAPNVMGSGIAVSGRVTDASGNPLAGIVVGDTYNNPPLAPFVVTDINGNYSTRVQNDYLYELDVKGVDPRVVTAVNSRTKTSEFSYKYSWQVAGRGPLSTDNAETQANDLVSDTGMDFVIDNGDLVTVSGKVTNSHGAPLSGVTINVCGFTAVGVTDASGNYSFQMAKGYGYCVRVTTLGAKSVRASKARIRNASSYEHQVAGRGPSRKDNANVRAQDLSRDSGLDFVVTYPSI